MFRPGQKRQRRRQNKDDPLERFEKPIPNERADWYKARASPNEDREAESGGDSRAPEQQEDSDIGSEWDEEDGWGAWQDNLETTENSPADEDEDRFPEWVPRPEQKGAFVEGEVPERLRYKSEALKKDESSPPEEQRDRATHLTKESLKELKEKYDRLASSADPAMKDQLAKSRDFREVHREAVRAKRAGNVIGFDESSGNRQSDSVRSHTTRSGIPVSWILLIGFAILGVLAAVFSGALGGRAEKVGLKEAEGGAYAELPKESMEAVMQRFFSAEKWEEILGDVRAPEQMKPLMKTWYEERPYEPNEFEILKVSEGMMSLGEINAPEQMWVGHVDVQLSESIRPSPVFLERTVEGYKVDWESTVGYAPLSFDTFAARGGTPESEPLEFRVSIAPADYYNYDFESRNDWRCFTVRHISSDSVLYGYLRKAGTNASVQALFYPGEPSIPVIATLLFPNAESKRRGQVEIVEIKQKNWVKRY